MAEDQIIFKVCSRALWEEAIEQGEFRGAEIDLADGFIHFSTAHQVVETAAKHFRGQTDLVLVSVHSKVFGGKLKWEVSRGGDLFPHLFGVFPTQEVLRVDALPLGEGGTHEFPHDLRLDGDD